MEREGVKFLGDGYLELDVDGDEIPTGADAIQEDDRVTGDRVVDGDIGDNIQNLVAVRVVVAPAGGAEHDEEQGKSGEGERVG